MSRKPNQQSRKSVRNHVIACFFNPQPARCNLATVREARKAARSGAHGYHGSKQVRWFSSFFCNLRCHPFWKGVAISTYKRIHTVYKKQGWMRHSEWFRYGSVSKPCSSHQNSWDLWMFIPLKMVLIGIDPYPYGPNIWGSGPLKQRRLDKSGFPNSARARSLHSSFSCWTVHNRH